MLHEDVQVSGGKASRILNLGSEWGGGGVSYSDHFVKPPGTRVSGLLGGHKNRSGSEGEEKNPCAGCKSNPRSSSP
jgi:hypothetical protein